MLAVIRISSIKVRGLGPIKLRNCSISGFEDMASCHIRWASEEDAKSAIRMPIIMLASEGAKWARLWPFAPQGNRRRGEQ